MRHFVKASVLKDTLDVSIQNRHNREVERLSVKINRSDFSNLLFLAMELATFNAVEGDELILVSNDPRATQLAALDSSRVSQWADVYCEAESKGLTLGAVRKDGTGYVYKKYGKEEMPIIPKEELNVKSGELVNDGRLIAMEIGEYKKKKRSLFEVIIVPSISISSEFKDEERKKLKVSYRDVAIGNTRATRFFNKEQVEKAKIVEIVDMKNRVMRLDDSTIISRLSYHEDGKADPLLLFEGVERPADWIPKENVQWAQWKASVNVFRNGITLRGIHYVWAFSSAAGMRTSTAVFVRSDIKIRQEVLNLFPKDYLEVISDLSEIEKLFDILSFGGYSKMKGTKASVAKVLARLGLCLSTSVDLGPIKAKGIGRVIVPWGNHIKDSYRRVFESLNWEKGRIENNLSILEKNWKEDAWDGMNLIRASWAVTALKAAGVKKEDGSSWQEGELEGMCLQFRYVSVKGLGVVVPDFILDSICVEGKYIYRGHDLLAEENSVKFEWDTRTFVGGLSPSFELVGISKNKGSSTVDAQLINCLEFDSVDDQELLKARMKRNIQKMVAEVDDISVARGAKGIIGHAWYGHEEINPFTRHRSFTEGYLQTCGQLEGKIEEPYIAKAIMTSYMGEKDLGQLGKFDIDGGRWFMIPDISPIWLAEYVRNGVDFISGEAKYDILVTKPEQAAISLSNEVWASGVTGLLASYRNPLNSAGEIVFSEGISLDSIKDQWARRLYENMTSSIVFSVFSASANLMGGGDFDGDRAMVIWDQNILPLLKRKDLVLLEVEDATDKKIISYESMRDFISNSLCNPGIGLITNYGTTWQEIRHMFKWFLTEGKEKTTIPPVYITNYEAPGEYKPMPLSHFFNRNKDKGWKGVSIIARKNLQNYESIMEDWEREAAEDISRVAEYSNLLCKRHINKEELEILAPVVIKACDSAGYVVRYLQELAINTAKSDIWAFYRRSEATGELKAYDRYNYICILPRPAWKKKFEKNNTFNFLFSPMGVVSSFYEEVYNDYYKKTMKSCSPMEDLITSQETELYKEIAVMVVNYNEAIKQTISRAGNHSSRADKEAAYSEIKLIKSIFRYKIQTLLYKYDALDVLKCAYTATYKYADIENGRKLSFVYAVLGEELLVYINNKSLGTDQVVPIPVSTVNGAELKDGIYPIMYDPMIRKTIILDSELQLPLGVVSCRTDETEIEVFVSKDRVFAKVYIPRAEKMAVNKDFNREVALLGLSDYDYSEQKLHQNIRSKVGLSASKQAFKLGELQDLVEFRKREIEDKNGIATSVISAYIGGEIVGNVCTEQYGYINKMLGYGKNMVVEITAKSKFSKNSARIRIIDVIAE